VIGRTREKKQKKERKEGVEGIKALHREDKKSLKPSSLCR
jgi:hypothetical protein